MLRIFREQVAGRPFLILGLGRAGRALANALLHAEADVAGYDDDESVWHQPVLQELVGLGLRRICRVNHQLLTPRVTIVASPGFPAEHPVVRFLTDNGISVYDELDFASKFLSGVQVAVTGTNGKSTTVSLIAAILKQAGKKVFVGGNLAPGKPLSAALNMNEKDFYVIEVSSFQLRRARALRPKVAVLLNITEDHLDRHRSFADYVRCKLRIFEYQQRDDWAVLNYDDPSVRKGVENVRAEIVWFSRKKIADAYVAKGWFWFKGKPVVSVSELLQRWMKFYNLRYLPVIENALAAVCVAQILQIPVPAIKQALRRFKQLPHRMEFVSCLDGVYFFNNSMCTNPEAGVRSLKAWRKKVILIAGGKEKSTNFKNYLDTIRRRAKCVVLLGENSNRLAEELSSLGFAKYEIAGSMKDAVVRAYQHARPGDIVVLSPGFASFDLFHDFQERGRAFRNAVRQLQ